MKKIVKLLGVLTMFGLLFIIFPNLVSASDMEIPKGVLVTDDQGISLTKSNGYFFNVKNIFPGDTITREIEVQNKRSEDVGINIKISPIRLNGPINLIKMIEMKLTYEDKVIFDGNLVSLDKKIFESGSEVSLGKLPANTTRKININLYVSPNIPVKDLLNVESEALVRWDLKATADGKTEPAVTPIKDKTLNKGILPQTGEKLTLLLSMLAILSLLLALYLYRTLYRKTDT